MKDDLPAQLLEQAKSQSVMPEHSLMCAAAIELRRLELLYFAALGQLRAVPAWQPIETAGRDGRYLWLSDGAFMRIGFWAEGRWADFERSKTGGPSDLLFVPTHWQPLPTPPVNRPDEPASESKA